MENLAGQFGAILAGVVVVEERNEKILEFLPAPSRNWIADPVQEHEGKTSLAERLLKHNAVHRVIWTSETIAVGNEDVRNLGIVQSPQFQRFESDSG